jgi:hypothetical protein
MSKDEKPKIDAKPHRYLKSHKDPDNPRIECSLGIRRVTIDELRDHFVVHYPDVDFGSLEIGGIHLRWEEAPTLDELDELRRRRAAAAEKQEEWERKTYERLRVKFEGYDVMDVVE